VGEEGKKKGEFFLFSSPFKKTLGKKPEKKTLKKYPNSPTYPVAASFGTNEYPSDAFAASTGLHSGSNAQ
jgi:hypothetical protein